MGHDRPFRSKDLWFSEFYLYTFGKRGMNCLRSLGRCDRGFQSELKACTFGVCVSVYSVQSVFVLSCV
jgi:hypothetical protein